MSVTPRSAASCTVAAVVSETEAETSRLSACEKSQESAARAVRQTTLRQPVCRNLTSVPFFQRMLVRVAHTSSDRTLGHFGNGEKTLHPVWLRSKNYVPI